VIDFNLEDDTVKGISAAILYEQSNTLIQQVTRDGDGDARDERIPSERFTLHQSAEDVVLPDVVLKEFQGSDIILSRAERRRLGGVRSISPPPELETVSAVRTGEDDDGSSDKENDPRGSQNYQASGRKRRRLDSDSIQERLEPRGDPSSGESFLIDETCLQAPSVSNRPSASGRVQMTSGSTDTLDDILEMSQSPVPLPLSAVHVRPDTSFAPDDLRVSDINHMIQEQLFAQDPPIDHIHTPHPSASATTDADFPFLSRSRAVTEFAQLRSKNLTYDPPAPTEQKTASPHSSEPPVPRTVLPQTLPPNMYDKNTLQLPDNWSGRGDTHRYMASLDIIQKQVLVRCLASQECAIDLIERETLHGVDLIIDSHTAVMFFSLPCLPSQCDALCTKVSDLTWRYSTILIVFEAFSPSLAFVPDHKNEKRISTYSQPVLKSVGRFRRVLAMNGSESIKKLDKACRIQYAFAENVEDAALYTRYFGEIVQDEGGPDPVLWDEREWLDGDVPAVCLFLFLYLPSSSLKWSVFW
jgi:hypothetical protein